MIHWLHKLGIRRGELLAVRTPDINGRSQEVSIARRPDAADDPRGRQPLVKTRGRDLRMSALFKDSQHYLLDVRRSVPGAARHPFLFVDMRTGRPLSHSALTKIFGELSAALGFRVTAHLLRHRWNDEFSARMDREGVPEDTERKIRSYLQGWGETSKSAANYTRRHVREAADKHMLGMQKKTFRKGGTNDGE